jgi:hypothetical protein
MNGPKMTPPRSLAPVTVPLVLYVGASCACVVSHQPAGEDAELARTRLRRRGFDIVEAPSGRALAALVAALPDRAAQYARWALRTGAR